ncbi:related to MAK11 protein (maintenance of killer toxin-encoding satellite M1 dsRNA) [Phialocephala subalpina]|uniref:Related to MAK11 protein (Maintenance of killer toxin-encoding satellite M1 dsRNA) n=1 Tax=Phialocephala subalpina TaxID=576137 RepID=A0A1L7XUP8_9HELO|nr:related to MAK11 protein (maintenance of killer toxin-encoding satellite M1 dsRNA) [Phialocephala subalpina]
MAKRKRSTNGESAPVAATTPSKKVKAAPSTSIGSVTIQIVAGSYDRVLHGVTATISPKNEVQFADTFLFNAHASAIRCLAISPASAPSPKQTQKVILASGSTDERINLYHLSAHAPSKITVPIIPSLTSKAVVENPQNRELGSLLHHASSVTALYFPNRSKLLSSAEDNTIAVTRTRDWSLLSTIKAPNPKPVGRPSGDTAPMGTAPSGVNDFAVHPSMKLMISVGKGEKCMRLWNLVTGKKAGVLNFDRGILAEVGEGRHSSGEGRKVAWGSTDAGDEFCVGFERGVLVFGMDSKPKCKVMPEPRTKIHELCYVQVEEEDDVQLMALSTEDGRILFYSTKQADLIAAKSVEGKETPLPSAKLIAQLGGKDVELSGRIKDFSILTVGEGSTKDFIVVAAGSDGALRLWKISSTDLASHSDKVKQIGKLLGTYETGNRITCLRAFVMLPKMEGAEDDDIGDLEGLEEDEDGAESNDSDSD